MISLRILIGFGFAVAALACGGSGNSEVDGGGADTMVPGDAQGEGGQHSEGGAYGASCMGNAGFCQKNDDPCKGANAGQASCGAGLFCCESEGVPPYDAGADVGAGCETAAECGSGEICVIAAAPCSATPCVPASHSCQPNPCGTSPLSCASCPGDAGAACNCAASVCIGLGSCTAADPGTGAVHCQGGG